MPDENPNAEEATGELAADLVVQRSFWQHPFIQNVVPVAGSLLLHLGIILVGFATFEVVKQRTQVQREQIIIPDATLVEGAEVGGLPNPGLGLDPEIVSDVQIEIEQQAQKLAAQSVVSLGALENEATPSGVIGPGAGSTSVRLGGALGTAEAAGATPFGVPGGSGGMAPKSPFMGVSGNAHRIVYICDASASMIKLRHVVVEELAKALKPLKPIQFFNVLLFRNGDFDQLQTGQLIPATPANKRSAAQFMDEMQIDSVGDPTRAVLAAMAMEPELLYLLTDGFDQRGVAFAKQLRAKVESMNRTTRATINVIYIADKTQYKTTGGEIDEVTRAGVKAELQALAEENHGILKVIETE